jgi:type II pantothenate kinase
MKKGVKIMATGGGAHLFYDRLAHDLGVEVRREEEMDCLITGLSFITEIPNEVFWYSDELVFQVSHPNQQQQRLPPATDGELERPSPNPPQYSVLFDTSPTPQLPCLLVNIGSGVSIIKVDQDGKFERVSGTSLGGGTLWGLLSILTGAQSFDGSNALLSLQLRPFLAELGLYFTEMLQLSERGNNGNVDMLVGDIYGSDYSKIGLKSSTIASTFGKVFRKGQGKRDFRPEDIARSLLYAVSNNIGQIAYVPFLFDFLFSRQ